MCRSRSRRARSWGWPASPERQDHPRVDHLLIARPPLHVEEGTLEIDGQVQELGGHAKIPRTWRGAVVSMLPQGAMNSISPTKRIRQLVYDVMRSHESRISKEEALDRARERLTTLGLPARVLDAYPHQLSGGMKQRTVTIISTLLNPRLLVPMSQPRHSM